MNRFRIINKEAFCKRLRSYPHDLDDTHMTDSYIYVCANCHRFNDIDGSWQPLESSQLKDPRLNWSHTICPDCAKQLYGKEKWFQEWLSKTRNS